MMKRQRHLAAPPMITSVGAEPNPGAHGSYTYRESLGHSFDPPDLIASRALHVAHVPDPRVSPSLVPDGELLNRAWLYNYANPQFDLIGQAWVGDKLSTSKSSRSKRSLGARGAWLDVDRASAGSRLAVPTPSRLRLARFGTGSVLPAGHLSEAGRCVIQRHLNSQPNITISLA